MFRELIEREVEMFLMIRKTSFHDIVDVVRREIYQSRYNARKELKELRNFNGEDQNNGK